MDVSISAAIRTPRVDAGLGYNALSQRTLEKHYRVAPSPIVTEDGQVQDQYGRLTSHRAHPVVTAGQNPSYIMQVESDLRPSVAASLPTYQGHNPGTTHRFSADHPESFGGYDTAGVNRDIATGHGGHYGVPYSAPQGISKEEWERQRQRLLMQRKYNADRFSSSGM